MCGSMRIFVLGHRAGASASERHWASKALNHIFLKRTEDRL
jgi:hypothetical protein